jgi:hypothetical protein
MGGSAINDKIGDHIRSNVDCRDPESDNDQPVRVTNIRMLEDLSQTDLPENIILYAGSIRLKFDKIVDIKPSNCQVQL